MCLIIFLIGYEFNKILVVLIKPNSDVDLEIYLTHQKSEFDEFKPNRSRTGGLNINLDM